MKEKRRVTLLGLGETGLASALFLKEKGYSVFVSDGQSSEALEKRAAQLEEARIPFELGKHTIGKICETDWVLISPGISPSAEIYQQVREKGIPVASEIEAASWFSQGRVTAVTGTSGKTTVSTLLHRIYKANGLQTLLCGNIGNPWIHELGRVTPETEVVLEVSSFQLFHTQTFRPDVGILLNIGRNHLDWHSDLKEYVAAKLRLFQRQKPEDYAMFRSEEQKVFFPEFQFRSQVIHFDQAEGKDWNEKLLLAVTRLKGLDLKKTKEVLAQFEGIEHRLEKVAEIDGVQFVNDSKCTTIEALVWALERFPAGKIILLAGGHPKGADFRSVRELLTKRVKQAVVYGEAQDLLWESWRDAASLMKCPGLTEAFAQALKVARPGDVVLLSPACASFDQFNNYQERGRRFKELVSKMKIRESSPVAP